MAANTNPLFIGVPNTAFTALNTAGNTNMDGTGTVYTVFTAGANGSYLRRLRVKAGGTNAASVMRIFVNNGATQATATNNALIGEMNLPAATASNTASVVTDLEYVLNLVLKAAYTIIVCFGTAGAAGWIVTAEGGDF